MTGQPPPPACSVAGVLARYNILGDRGQIDVLATLFAPDGTLKTPLWTAIGRDDIARHLRLGASFGDVRPSFVRHHLTTSSLISNLHVDAVSGRTYFQVITDVGLDHAGIYVDHLVRLGQDWVFQRREVRIDWKSPDSLFPKLPVRPLNRYEPPSHFEPCR